MPDNNEPILVADNVTRTFGGLTAVDVDHLEIPRNKITALIGPNGAGKTTFFNLLTGFDEADSGTWTFNGKQIANTPAHKVAQMGMVRTFQLTKVLSKLTVLENMRLGATGQRGRSSSSHRSRHCGVRRRARSPNAPANSLPASHSIRRKTSLPDHSPAVSANCLRWHAH